MVVKMLQNKGREWVKNNNFYDLILIFILVGMRQIYSENYVGFNPTPANQNGGFRPSLVSKVLGVETH